MSLASLISSLFFDRPHANSVVDDAQSRLNLGDLSHGKEKENGTLAKFRFMPTTPAPPTHPAPPGMAEKQREGTEPQSRPPYLHSMLAGGLGGTTGDLLMHSIDTVKTRQQGDPHSPPKYTSMSSSYMTIFRQEGIRRGLYGGIFPAFLGSFPGTIIFFGTYEYSKRHLKDAGVNPHISYLTAGFLADLAASVIYVPSEVLKTRLQLQGRHNNPFFKSGYNYRSTLDATRTIIRHEGLPALFYGYKATLFRDLPFSALQFAFYEQAQEWARDYAGSRHIGLAWEIATAGGAGGLAGVLTCPMDVVKTRIQTQVNATPSTSSGHKSQHELRPPTAVNVHTSPKLRAARTPAMNLDTSSVVTGLRLIYRSEGVAGWFRGVGPRFVWTSVQSCTMLVLYQVILRQFASRVGVDGRVHGAHIA